MQMQIQRINNQSIMVNNSKKQNKPQNFGALFHFRINRNSNILSANKFYDSVSRLKKQDGSKIITYAKTKNDFFIACNKEMDRKLASIVYRMTNNIKNHNNEHYYCSKGIDIFSNPKFKGFDTEPKELENIFKAQL